MRRFSRRESRNPVLSGKIGEGGCHWGRTISAFVAGDETLPISSASKLGTAEEVTKFDREKEGKASRASEEEEVASEFRPSLKAAEIGWGG